MESHFLSWVATYLMNKSTNAIKEGYRKQSFLGLEGISELNEIKKTNNIHDDIDLTSEGCLVVCHNEKNTTEKGPYDDLKYQLGIRPEILNR